MLQLDDDVKVSIYSIVYVLAPVSWSTKYLEWFTIK